MYRSELHEQRNNLTSSRFKIQVARREDVAGCGKAEMFCGGKWHLFILARLSDVTSHYFTVVVLQYREGKSFKGSLIDIE